MQPVRAALLLEKEGKLFEALDQALRSSDTRCEIRHLNRGWGAAPFLRLLFWKPDVVVAEAGFPGALPAALYRVLLRHSELLLCATDRLQSMGPYGRVVLRVADRLLTSSDSVHVQSDWLSLAANMPRGISLPADIDLFLEPRVERFGPSAFRVLYVGPLSPESGAADLLICLAAWAEQHPNRELEVWWAGQGDLAGVLGAQPVPANILQRFLPGLDRPALASCCGQCGVLLLPPLAAADEPPVAEALAAGLIVVGSERSAIVRRLSRENLGCWTFDPVRLDTMLDVLAKILGSREIELNRLRNSGRSIVRRAGSQSFAERAHDAITATLPAGAIAAAPL